MEREFSVADTATQTRGGGRDEGECEEEEDGNELLVASYVSRHFVRRRASVPSTIGVADTTHHHSMLDGKKTINEFPQVIFNVFTSEYYYLFKLID